MSSSTVTMTPGATSDRYLMRRASHEKDAGSRPSSPTRLFPTTASLAAVVTRAANGPLGKAELVNPSSSPSIRTRLRSLVHQHTSQSGNHPPPAPFSVSPPSAERASRPPISSPAGQEAPPRRARRRQPSDFPVLQRGNDGRWQPPSLSKGSISASDLILPVDEDVRLDIAQETMGKQDDLRADGQEDFARSRSLSDGQATSNTLSSTGDVSAARLSEHWPLRIVTVYLVRSLTSIVRHTGQISDQRARLLRHAERSLQILDRMQKAWTMEWRSAADFMITDKSPDVMRTVQERLQGSNVSQRTASKERDTFMDAIRDGVLLCLLLQKEIQVRASGMHISLTVEGHMRGSNIRQFAEGCRRLGMAEVDLLQVKHVHDGSIDAAARVAKSIMTFARHTSKTAGRVSQSSASSVDPALPTAGPRNQQASPASSPSSAAARARAARWTISRRMSIDMPASPMHSVLREAELQALSSPDTPPKSRRVFNRSITEPIPGLPATPPLLRTGSSPDRPPGTTRAIFSFAEPDHLTRRSGVRPSSTFLEHRGSAISPPPSLTAYGSRALSGLSESTHFSSRSVQTLPEGSALEVDEVKGDDAYRCRESSGKTLRDARDRFNAMRMAPEEAVSEDSRQMEHPQAQSLVSSMDSSKSSTSDIASSSEADSMIRDELDKHTRSSLRAMRGTSSILLARDRPAPVLRRRSTDRSTRVASPRGSPDNSTFRRLLFSPPGVSPIRESPSSTPSYIYGHGQPGEPGRLDRARSPSQSGRRRDPASRSRPQSTPSSPGDSRLGPIEPIILDAWDREGRNVGYAVESVEANLVPYTNHSISLLEVFREVEIIKRLEHSRIVKYEGLCIQDNHLHIILEWVENGSLLEMIRQFGPFNPEITASSVSMILEGLEYLHAQDVVHCDLKAANILSTKHGTIKLTDFGVSLNNKAMEHIQIEYKSSLKMMAETGAVLRHDSAPQVMGTPYWMAPEVIRLQGASSASDIWSLGCTIVELLTGKAPYAASMAPLQAMFAIVEDDMPPLPVDLTIHMDDFLKRCFRKNPRDRPSAQALMRHPWLSSQKQQDKRSGEYAPLPRRDSWQFDRPASPTPLTELLARTRVLSAPVNISSNDGGGLSPNSSQSWPKHDDESTEHSYIKTTFGKLIACHLCQRDIIKTAHMCKDCGILAHSSCASAHLVGCDRHLVRRQMLSPSTSFTSLSLNARDVPRFRLPPRILSQLQRHSAHGPSVHEADVLPMLHSPGESRPKTAISLAVEAEALDQPDSDRSNTRSRTTSGAPGETAISERDKRRSMPGGLDALGSARLSDIAFKRDSGSECLLQ